MRIEVLVPWHADYVNYLACGVLPPNLSYHQKEKFLHDVKFLWDDPLLFKRCSDQIIKRCVPMEKVPSILTHCHASPCRGHFKPNRTIVKVLKYGFYWPSIFKDNYAFIKLVTTVKEWETSQDAMSYHLPTFWRWRYLMYRGLISKGHFLHRLGKCTFC